MPLAVIYYAVLFGRVFLFIWSVFRPCVCKYFIYIEQLRLIAIILMPATAENTIFIMLRVACTFIGLYFDYWRSFITSLIVIAAHFVMKSFFLDFDNGYDRVFLDSLISSILLLLTTGTFHLLQSYVGILYMKHQLTIQGFGTLLNNFKEALVIAH